MGSEMCIRDSPKGILCSGFPIVVDLHLLDAGFFLQLPCRRLMAGKISWFNVALRKAPMALGVLEEKDRVIVE